jgi:hypothetical protein
VSLGCTAQTALQWCVRVHSYALFVGTLLLQFFVVVSSDRLSTESLRHNNVFG